jgi:anaerobic ribonucleoside-triphosphate reductase
MAALGGSQEGATKYRTNYTDSRYTRNHSRPEIHLHDLNILTHFPLCKQRQKLCLGAEIVHSV